jgi:hypothetical protein
MTYIANLARSKGDPRVLHLGPSSLQASDRLARCLGWFSLGLGLVELLAPRRVTQVLGMEGKEALVRSYGAREIASGILSLSTEKQLGLWSRVAGDGLDIATLVPEMRAENPKRDNVALALAMVLGVTALDLVAAKTTAALHSRPRGLPRSYRERSGFPQGVDAARGAARDLIKPATHSDAAEQKRSALSA